MTSCQLKPLAAVGKPYHISAVVYYFNMPMMWRIYLSRLRLSFTGAEVLISAGHRQHSGSISYREDYPVKKGLLTFDDIPLPFPRK
jgi:hypothetical protein